MIIKAYRITKTRYADHAFSGEGARLAGGRWNPIGSRMVYLASSLSLATLELLVHTEDYPSLLKLFSYIEVQFDSKLVEIPALDELPTQWNSPEILTGTQIYGDSWLRQKRSLALAIPSAVTPNELNYLINPEHPDFKTIEIDSPKRFQPDLRLIK